MPCTEHLQTQAYFDGELDAAASLRAERHLATCSECREFGQLIASMRTILREKASYHAAPLRLSDGVRVARYAERRKPESFGLRVWDWLAARKQLLTGAGMGMTGAALAAALAMFAIGGQVQRELADDVVAAHVRSLIGDHLTDLASADRHTVKPWFVAHADISPPVGDFPRAGFRLVGARTDYVDGRRAAVTVYRHGPHVVNVFAWKDRGDVKPAARMRNGYEMISWKERGLFLCAVSDTSRQELMRLSQLIEKNAPAQE